MLPTGAGDDWSEGRVGPDSFMRIVALKHRTVEAAFRVSDRALDLSGGFGMFKKSELLTDEIVGKISLGISPDEQPWRG